MKLTFLELAPDERRLYVEQAAVRRGMSPVVLEKDFWVRWLLGVLFTSEFAGRLVFKPGTSLSKVFGVIDRFSEDIDLSLAPEFLNLPEAGPSRTQANKWMTKAEAACGEAVRVQIAPALEQTVAAVLGERPGGRAAPSPPPRLRRDAGHAPVGTAGLRRPPRRAGRRGGADQRLKPVRPATAPDLSGAVEGGE